MYFSLHLQVSPSFQYNIHIYPNLSWSKMFPAAILTFCKIVYLTFHFQHTARVYGIKSRINTMCNVSQPPFRNSKAYLHVASRFDNSFGFIYLISEMSAILLIVSVFYHCWNLSIYFSWFCVL